MEQNKAAAIQDDYLGNTGLLRRFLEGISHEESLQQLPMPGNCLNWLLGHIVARRNTALELLGGDPVWEQEWTSVYRSGSEPIRDGRRARDFHVLLEDLGESARRIEQALQGVREADLLEKKETDRGVKPVWEHLDGLHWHETFHVGQVEMVKDFIHAQRGAAIENQPT